MRLGNLCEIVRGSSPRPKGDARFYGGSVPRLMVADVTRDGKYVTPRIDSLTQEGAALSRPMQKGDLVIAVSGNPGLSAILEIDACIHDGFVGLRNLNKARTSVDYLYRYLMFFKEQINSKAVGAIFKNLTTHQIADIKIPLPPLEEQRRIAAILDKADAVRRKRQSAIALTEELLRSAFLEMFGDPIINPRGWEEVELGDLLTFLTSGSRGWAKFYAPEGKLFLRIQNVRDGKLLLDDIAYVSPPDSAEASRTLVKEGDVLVSITADLGRTAVIPKEFKPAHINQHLALLRLKRECISPVYLAAFLASISGQLQFARLNREGVKAGLNFDDIRGLHILLPPLETQMEYEKFFIHQTDTLNQYKQGCDAAQSLFNSLLQKAFRGEL